MAHTDSTLSPLLRVRASGAVLALTVGLALAGCSPIVPAPSNDSPGEVQPSADGPVAEAPVNETPAEPAPAPAPGGDTVDSDAIVGVWSPSDDSGLKIIDGNGACSGMYYNNGSPLDIGGPMSCALGSQQSSDGSYLLVVTQAPNQASYPVLFAGDSFTLYSGNQVITMTRQ